MEKLATIGLCLYCLAYALEGALRYGLNTVGMDGLIFVRDAVLLLPVFLLGGQQFLARKLHPAYLVFLALVLLHGFVFFANFRLLPPVVMGAKVLAGWLAGAVLCDRLMKPSPRLIWFFLALWVTAFVGVTMDKFVGSFPWVGLTTTIGDVQVDIGRDWQIENESDAYRAGGFMRSSIHAANLTPLLGLVLALHLPNKALRIIVGALTLPVLYWTTQKGSMVAYAVVLLVLLLSRRDSVMPLRVAFLAFLVLAIALPVGLPGYYMPTADAGGFSNMSFNLRVEMMWPKAWTWIHRHEVFPFGVGLGGISGAQQLYALNEINAADNIFVFMYAYFGLMAVVYLGLTLWAYFRSPAKAPADRLALAVLLFIIIYGCVLSMLEDQMTALFTGAALGWVAYGRKVPPREKDEQKPATLAVAAPPR